ncbi:hypothetical protein NDU88_004053 [Pleurodeles waltl]|uniref:Uncharacterized protein n=1 Tax=Pleurodeles waltl TaxID=8319 RepID=A0AAV7SHN4_PLEWA|nr:hypothetical protein NDU88_004053 [Pleurodeles waltl]
MPHARVGFTAVMVTEALRTERSGERRLVGWLSLRVSLYREDVFLQIKQLIETTSASTLHLYKIGDEFFNPPLSKEKPEECRTLYPSPAEG